MRPRHHAQSRLLGRLIARVVWQPTGIDRGFASRINGWPDDRGLSRAVSGRTVVVTGASSGIGRATALKLASAGADLALVARTSAALEDVRSAIVARGATATAHPTDLSDLRAIDHLVDELHRSHGAIDVLVNNAGRSIRRSLLESQDRFHDFERTMQLNYFGAVRLTMGLVPAMCEQGRGLIVHVSTIGTQVRAPRFGAYIASKSAFDAFGDVLAAELHRKGVRFTSIRMPLVRTPMIASARGAYANVPSLGVEEAADVICAAITRAPRSVGTRLGDLAALAHAVTPDRTVAALAAYDRGVDRRMRRREGVGASVRSSPNDPDVPVGGRAGTPTGMSAPGGPGL